MVIRDPEEEVVITVVLVVLPTDWYVWVVVAPILSIEVGLRYIDENTL